MQNCSCYTFHASGSFVLFPSHAAVLNLGENGVCDDSEDESRCDSGDGDFACDFTCFGNCVGDADNKSSDTGDEYRSNYEKVLVVGKVDILEHLKSRYGDEAVESQANAAHYAGGNGAKESHYGADEGKHDAHNCGSGNGAYGSVSRDGNAANGFTVCGVGADTEHGTGNGAYTVTEKCAVKSGILDKIAVDDGGEVLVVCDVLCEHNESNGEERHDNFNSTAQSKNGCISGGIGDFRGYRTCCNLVNCAEESDSRVVEDSGNSLEGAVGVNKVIYEGREVYDFEVVVVASLTDEGEYSGGDIACGDTDDEGDQLRHGALLLSGADDDSEECDKSAEKGH